MVQQEKPNNMSSVLKRPTQKREGTNYPKLSSDLQVAQKCTHAYAHTHACAHLPHHEKKTVKLVYYQGKHMLTRLTEKPIRSETAPKSNLASTERQRPL